MENEQYLYFVIRQSKLDELAYKTNKNHYKLQVGSNREFIIGCDVINRSNDTDPYVILRSTSDFQNTIFLKDVIESFRNDNTVLENRGICKLYYNKCVSNDLSYPPSETGFMRYFTDKALSFVMKVYGFEEKDAEDSPTYNINMKNGIDFFNTIVEYVKNNKTTKENKDMPPYKHHICLGGPEINFRDGFQVPCKILQEAKHLIVKDIKFNDRATIVFYADGSKEVVKRQKDDKDDKEKAIYMAMLKHKNKKLFSMINKALSSEDPEKALAYELLKYEGGDAKLLHQICNDFIKAEKPKKKIKKNKAKVATKKINKSLRRTNNYETVFLCF